MKAWLVFIDEAAVLMAPLVRRTWHPKGRTPVLHQRTRLHQKVSVIAALCVAPQRDRVCLYFRLHPNTNINALCIFSFLRYLERQLDAPWMLIWDRLRAHRAHLITGFVDAAPALRITLLPPYAPELNPVEYLWGLPQTQSLGMTRISISIPWWRQRVHTHAACNINNRYSARLSTIVLLLCV